MPASVSRFLAALGAALILVQPACTATEGGIVRSQQHAFQVVTLLSGLSNPWSIVFLPDGRWLITERPGRLRIAEGGRLLPEPVAGLPPIRVDGQGGLFDVVLHPDYARNGWLYLSYAGPGDAGEGTEVMRARLVGNRLSSRSPGRPKNDLAPCVAVAALAALRTRPAPSGCMGGGSGGVPEPGTQLTDRQTIFRMQPKLSSSIHFGGRLAFDRRGYLFITLGERGRMKSAQDLTNHLGSVVRLHDDGRVPADNPFVGRPGVRPEIYTYGHRNVQGAALHPVTGLVWTHEHGPQGGDEINILRPGVNHGWPVITYGVNYGLGTPIGEGTHKPGMAQPLYRWTPSIAPSGMAFYEAKAFPRWRGNLFVGALKDQMLVRLTLDGERVIGEERLLKGIDRIRDVRVGPDGLIYLLTDEDNGRLLRLEPAGSG